MNNKTIAIEITSSAVKMVVGYVLDDKVDVIYSRVEPVSLINEAGKFLDYNLAVKTLSSFRSIRDSSANYQADSEDVVVILPPFGLEVFQTTQTTTVIGNGGCVSDIDVKNLFSLIIQTPISSDNVLADIVPDFFYTNDGVQLRDPPYDQPASTLSVCAKILTLPGNIIASYRQAFIDAGISIRRMMVAPFAAGSLINSYPNTPKDFLLVDIGSHMTTVSLIGNGAIYDSRYIDWGGSDITERIIQGFNVCESDAEKYKLMYGMDETVMNYPVPICHSHNSNGDEIGYNALDLNKIIRREVETLAQSLNIAVNQALKDYESSIKKIPMILIGGTSELHGLLAVLSPKVNSDQVIRMVPTSLGARNPGLFNCLGAIYADHRYLDTMTTKNSTTATHLVRKAV